jgi:hypothetical protein
MNAFSNTILAFKEKIAFHDFYSEKVVEKWLLNKVFNRIMTLFSVAIIQIPFYSLKYLMIAFIEYLITFFAYEKT